MGYGIGQVIGNTLAGQWTDRFGPDRVRLISFAGSAGTWVLLDLAVLSLVGGAVLANAGVGWLGPAAGAVALAGLALTFAWSSRSPGPAG